MCLDHCIAVYECDIYKALGITVELNMPYHEDCDRMHECMI